MVSITCLNSYVLPGLGQNLLLKMYTIPANIVQDLPLEKYVILSDTFQNLLFPMGFVRCIELSVCVMDHFFADSIHLSDL